MPKLKASRVVMNLAPIIKIVRAYDSTEIFISEWQKGLQGYDAVKRLGGPIPNGRRICSASVCVSTMLKPLRHTIAIRQSPVRSKTLRIKFSMPLNLH